MINDVNDQKLLELTAQAEILMQEAKAEKHDFVWFGYRKVDADTLPWLTRACDQSGLAILMALGFLDLAADWRDPLVTARIPQGASLLAKRGRGMIERQDLMGGAVSAFAGKLRQLEAICDVGAEFGIYSFYYLGDGRTVAGGLTANSNIEWLHYMLLVTLANSTPYLREGLLSIIPRGFHQPVWRTGESAPSAG